MASIQKHWRSVALLISTFLAVTVPAQNSMPELKREFRALWVATVDNVDWPSKPGLSSRQQKDELIAIMDRAVRMNLNVIVLQVRPCCDAIYNSPFEPWTEYLNGRMGQAPKPYYDPLAFAVEEAHKRGLELHAWFNPYRARVRDSRSPISTKHVSVQHPDLVRTYGKYLWLDPTEFATRQYSLNVILDVVRRYDIDGVHFDDYFYPYPEKARPSATNEMDFPDTASWNRYLKLGGKLSRNDWRRENVNMFVHSVYTSIHQEKPWVKFGISPFGIWQPGHPVGISGFNSYDKLYCDSRKWLEEGWVDYVVPQLYWPVAQKAQSFPDLLNWWSQQNTQHRLLFAGMKVNGWKNVDNEARETTNEILTTRRNPGASGEVLWHSKPLMTNHANVAETLRTTVYDEPALAPAYPWLSSTSPERPLISAKQNKHEVKISWKAQSGDVWLWVVRQKTGSHWTTAILPGKESKAVIPAEFNKVLPDTVQVAAVNRYGNLSEPATFNTAHLEQ